MEINGDVTMETTNNKVKMVGWLDQGVMYSSSPDDKLSENIWFVWFKTSYDGDVTMETNKRTTISENRASQQIDQGMLTFATYSRASVNSCYSS